ncbi:9540_t:CDS:1, partial [Paraglomus occultum]
NILETFDIDRDKQWTAFNESRASSSVEELTNQERENTDQAATDTVSADEDTKESVNTVIEHQEVDNDEVEVSPYVIKEKELESSSSGSDDSSINENLVKDVEIKDSTEENENTIAESSSNTDGDAPADIEMIDATSGDSANPDTDESVEEDIDKLDELSIPDVNSDNTDINMVEDEFIL